VAAAIAQAVKERDECHEDRREILKERQVLLLKTYEQAEEIVRLKEQLASSVRDVKAVFDEEREHTEEIARLTKERNQWLMAAQMQQRDRFAAEERAARLRAALEAVTESDHPHDVAWAALHKKGEA
jgi:hypothetical protein